MAAHTEILLEIPNNGGLGVIVTIWSNSFVSNNDSYFDFVIPDDGFKTHRKYKQNLKYPTLCISLLYDI